MKQNKNNQRSIRFTDEVKEIVESCNGNGFNEKFENMCLDYKNTIPKRKAQLERIELQKQEAYNELMELKAEIRKLDNIKYSLEAIQTHINKIDTYVTQ